MNAKRWLWRTAGAVGLCLALRVGWDVGHRTVVRANGERRLATAIAAADRTDPHWKWADLDAERLGRKPTPNGAEVVDAATRLLPAEWESEDFTEDLEAATRAQPRNQRLPAAAAARVRAHAKTLAAGITKARELAGCSSGYRTIALAPDTVSTLLPWLPQTRSACDLLELDQLDALLDGDEPRAFRATLALRSASRALGDEPFLISQLIRVAGRVLFCRAAERLLANGPGKVDLAALQEAALEEATTPSLPVGLRGERAGLHHLFTNVDAGIVGAPPAAGGASGQFSAFAWWLWRGRLPDNHAAVLEFLTAHIEAAGHPPHEWPTRFAAIPVPPNDQYHFLAQMMLPACARVGDSDRKALASLRCTVAGIACERLRQANGRWPTSMAEIPSAILPAAPSDPFTGEPLKFLALADGLVVYAVGPDGRDDGGNLNNGTVEPGTDIGFRLWDPDQRGVPAP